MKPGFASATGSSVFSPSLHGRELVVDGVQLWISPNGHRADIRLGDRKVWTLLSRGDAEACFHAFAVLTGREKP